MKEIRLNHGKVAIVDDEDYAAASSYRWYTYLHCGIWYVRRNLPRRSDGSRGTQYLHQLIISPPPPGMVIDHKDHDGLNNRRFNLRHATRGQNKANGRRRYPGIKGVWLCRNRWRVQVGSGGKYFRGQYATREEAVAAYNTAATNQFGEFASPTGVK